MVRIVDEISLTRPTKAQIREFWQRYGFQFVPRKEDPRFGSPQEYWAVYNHWVYPDGKHHRNLPVLSLNSLDKWILPKLFSWTVCKNWKLLEDHRIVENGIKATVDMVYVDPDHWDEAAAFYTISDKTVYALF